MRDTSSGGTLPNMLELRSSATTGQEDSKGTYFWNQEKTPDHSEQGENGQRQYQQFKTPLRTTTASLL